MIVASLSFHVQVSVSDRVVTAEIQNRIGWEFRHHFSHVYVLFALALLQTQIKLFTILILIFYWIVCSPNESTTSEDTVTESSTYVSTFLQAKYLEVRGFTYI